MAGNYIERLKQRQEAAKSTREQEPESPEPEALPNDPEVRAVWLQDELTNTR